MVAMCSKELSDHDVIAVSIMPTDSYLGVTVYEDSEITPEPTMEYFIDNIAMRLAGRVAEKMFTSTITSGAMSDLWTATKIAQDIVTKYGMVKFSKNRNYTKETQSEKVKNQINKEIDKLIDLATKRAEEILCANRKSLEELVDALMRKGIVGSEDLNKIFKDIVKM